MLVQTVRDIQEQRALADAALVSTDAHKVPAVSSPVKKVRDKPTTSVHKRPSLEANWYIHLK